MKVGRRGGAACAETSEAYHPETSDQEVDHMRIEVKGRNVTVGDGLRERVERRFEKVARQVSSLAQMKVELREERNPSIRESQVAEATLFLKGVTLRACERSTSMVQSINLASDDLARQVKRHRDKRRRRRESARFEEGAPAS